MHPADERTLLLSRRHFFGRTATGIGTAALASMLAGDSQAADGKRIGGLPGVPHFAPKAKRVIYLFQNGAPTHVDLFDYKPELTRQKGKQIPDSVVKGARFSTMTGGQTVRPCLPEITKFKQHGQSGAWVSDFLPHTARIADELCFVKSMHTTQVNHAPAICFFLTGSEMPGRPSAGAWLTYGLGSETEDLPRQGSELRANLLRLLLGQRLSPDQVSRREVPRARRPGAVSLQPRGNEQGKPPGVAR
jgi:hypothetical protein